MLRLSHQTDRIVITGLPGCGKSSLTRMMAEAGYPTWSADEVVGEAYAAGREGWQLIHHRFQGRFTRKGQAVDKAALGAAALETPGLREELESLIHPLVNTSLTAFWRQADNEHRELAFAEVPLWLETGSNHAKCRNPSDTVTVLGVRCPTAIRHERLLRLRHWSESMTETADSWQWPEENKMAACDVVIDNGQDLAHLLAGGLKFIRSRLKLQALRHAKLTAAWERLWQA